MNLLSELIPAIREVRAPLLGGYLWLFAVWLKFGADVPVSAEIASGSVWDNLHRLSGAAGALSLVAILSVAAYLIGAIVGEALNIIVARRLGFDGYALDNLSGVVPDARYLLDVVSRSYAEALLRFHVALPIATIAFILPGWAARIVALFAAALLMMHGVAYLTRARRSYGLAQSLAARRSQDAALSGQPTSTAEVRARMQLRDQARVLTITNTGPGIARAIDVRTAEGTLPDFIVAGYFPIEELRPGDAVDVLVAITFASPRTAKVVLSWEDGRGSNQEVVSLFLT